MIGFSKLKSSGAVVLRKTCERCGEPASFGVAASARRAMDYLEAGAIERARILMGRWYCAKHRPGVGEGEKIQKDLF